MQTKIDSIYKIDEKSYSRFEQKYNMIYRRLWDKSLPTFGKMFEYNINNHINSGEDGYSRIDFALVAAGWTVYENFPFAFSWNRKELIDIGYGVDWMREKFPIQDISSFTKKIKKAAKFYGASLVGIADVNEKWVYKTGFVRPESTSEADSKDAIRKGDASNSILETPINLPEGMNKVIVIAIEMDDVAISTAPAQPASAAAAVGYSKMAFSLACLGEFIRNLGYRAVQCGNDTALSIPLAIEAGLGALGRNGLLLTPEYGSRVRICKVFTDIPLKADNLNINFIKKIEKFCKTCFRCAEACETEAITKETDPSFKPTSISNNSCVKKYYVDVEKCFEYWIENSGDCGNCIAACPFSKIKRLNTSNEFWK